MLLCIIYTGYCYKINIIILLLSKILFQSLADVKFFFFSFSNNVIRLYYFFIIKSHFNQHIRYNNYINPYTEHNDM